MKVSAYIAQQPVERPPANPPSVVPTSAAPAAVAVDPLPPAQGDPVAADAAPRFCRACGSTWDSAWAECEPCARGRRRAAVLQEHAPEQRAVKSALALYFALLAVCATGIVAGLCGAGKGDGGLGVELAEIIGLAVVTFAWATADRRPVLPPLATVPGPGWFAAAVGLSLVTVAIATGTIGGYRHLFPTPPEAVPDPFRAAGYGWGFVVLCTCVQPAVVEELAFRGVIFAGVGRVLSRSETVLVEALMFMILHLSPVRFPHTLALGLGTGYLRTRTRSLYPGMAMHFAHNLMCVGGEYLKWF